MANTKISALTSASTPLAGTEVLPIVQSGATVKVAVSDLTTGRNITALGVTATNALVTTGGLPALAASRGFFDQPLSTLSRIGVIGPNTSTVGLWRVTQYSSDGSVSYNLIDSDVSGNLLFGATSNATYQAKTTLQAGSGTVWSVGPLASQTTRYYVLNASGTGVYLTDGGVAWIANSDERVKDIIEPITNAAAKLKTWRTVIGKYKTDVEGTRRAFFIAQDIQATSPEAVDASNPEQLGVQYSDTIPTVAAAVNEHTDQIAQLMATVQQLTAELAALKS
jgi:hypothetical protein